VSYIDSGDVANLAVTVVVTAKMAAIREVVFIRLEQSMKVFGYLRQKGHCYISEVDISEIIYLEFLMYQSFLKIGNRGVYDIQWDNHSYPGMFLSSYFGIGSR
jgi:hypothetical protein